MESNDQKFVASHYLPKRASQIDRLRGRSPLRSPNVAVVSVDAHQRVTSWNANAERMFGRTANESIGKLLVDVVSKSLEDLTVESSVSTGGVETDYGVIFDFYLVDGERHHLSCTVITDQIVVEDPGISTLTFVDLSDWLHSRGELVRSEARLQMMADGAMEGVVVFDADYRITFANERFAEMVGTEIDGLIGVMLDDLTFTEDLEDLEEMKVRRRQGIAEQQEHRIRRADGSELWTIKSITPVMEEDGSFTGAYAFFTDVSKRKIAERQLALNEQRLRSYFENVPVGIVLASLDGKILTVNPALCSITGISADELVGQELARFIGDHQAGDQGDLFEMLVRGDSPSFTTVAELDTADARSIWLETTVSLMRDVNGAPIEAVAVIADVSERRQTEQAKDEFLSVASHELRTPLTSIRGALGLLVGGVVGELPPPALRMLEIAVLSTDRLIGLINDILDLERLTTGKLSLAIEACDATSMVSRAVEEMRGAADVVDVEIRALSIEGQVWADSDRIIQALANLIGNAIKFSPPHSVIEVTSEIVGDEVRFSVIDSGPGIPSDQLERVFERFRQVDGSDTRAKGGTGLGLTISRSIIEQHGGQIWVESVLGEGSTFRFTLPRVAAIEAVDPQEGSVAPKVLICDDDALVREVVKTMLTGAGYRVWTASNGSEVLALARAVKPDVIVLDLLMPGIGGREAAANLKRDAETADIPIVILSVLSPGEIEVNEATTWVDKPIKGDALLVALRETIVGERAQVLIVEDDPQLSEVLAATLSNLGLEVRQAKSGREAIQLSSIVPPELLVLDLALPDGDGFSVIEWMRRQKLLKSIPVLVYTAFDLTEDDRERLRLGETRFLTKGRASPEALETKLEELLNLVTNRAPRK